MNNNKTIEKICDPLQIAPYSKWLEEEPEKPQDHDIIYTGSIENDPLYRKSTIK